MTERLKKYFYEFRFLAKDIARNSILYSKEDMNLLIEEIILVVGGKFLEAEAWQVL